MKKIILVKVVISISAGIFCVLLFTLICISNPEKTFYEETIETLMNDNECSSPQEAMGYFPQLRDIKSKIERIGYLTRDINSLTGGPAPTVSREESQQIFEITQEIQQLRRSVRVELNQLVTSEGITDAWVRE